MMPTRMFCKATPFKIDKYTWKTFIDSVDIDEDGVILKLDFAKGKGQLAIHICSSQIEYIVEHFKKKEAEKAAKK